MAINNLIKEKLLNKLKELINQSSFMSEDIYENAKSLNNERLEKLVIIIFNNLNNEKNLSDEDKKLLISKIKELSDMKMKIIKEEKAHFLKLAEDKDNKEDNEEVLALINTIN